MLEGLPPEIVSLAYTLAYLTAIGVAISVIYGIAEWFSHDRVLKLFEGKTAFVFLGKNAYYGKLKVPPRSGGGFEIFFPPEKIENPVSLLAFLIENYQETGEEKFLKEAQRLLDECRKRGVLPRDFSLEKVRIDPWAPPSLVSRKVYPNELGDLYAILIFKYTLSREELEKRWRELRRIYHPSIVYVAKRKVYNALAYVKDKVSTALTKTTSGALAVLTPELRKTVEEVEKKLVTGVGAAYDALLENSIGRLVTVEVQDIDGEKKLYQGILREYSGNYIALYDVDYRLQMVTKFRGNKEVGGYPQSTLKFHGWRLDCKNHLAVSVSASNNTLEIEVRNTSQDPVKVEKVKSCGAESSPMKVLFPGEAVTVKLSVEKPEPEPEVIIEYEISREADMVIPRSKVKIIGLGDYPHTLLPEVLKLKKARV